MKKFIRKEKEFAEWFKKNYKSLGYEKIIRKDIGVCPDFIMLKNDQARRVELETFSSNFLLHEHSYEDVDEIVCLKNDAKLEKKTIVAEKAPAKLPKTTSLKIDEDLWKKVKINCIQEGIEISEFLENIIKERLKKK